MKRLILMLVLITVSVPARADYYLRAKSMGSAEAESWTSGKKQRSQSSVTGLGQCIIITRLDKGVEWTVDPKTKMYQEKPIALPYAIAKEMNEDISDDDIQEVRKMTGVGAHDKDCTPVIHEKGTREVAGYETKGYYGACAEGNVEGESNMTMWIAPAQGDIAKMEKESEAYEKEHSKAMWSNYPAKDRKEIEEGAKVLRDAFKMAFGSVKGAKIPKGVPLAMEMSGGEEGMSGVFYEVTELKIQPVSQSIFDLPPGYRKVDDIAQEQANAMMKEMGMNPEAMKQMMSGAGIPAEAGTDE